MATVSDMRMCDGCLARGRSMTPLGSLRHIFTALTDCAADPERLVFCWECTALLRRAARFRLRAARIQFCLQTAVPFDKLGVELCSSLCAVGPVAEIHIHSESDDEQLTDIKCEYDSEADYDFAFTHSMQDAFEQQMLNHDIKTENKPIDLKIEFENVKSINCAETNVTNNLNENKNNYRIIKFSKKEIREHLNEKRQINSFIYAEYKCVKCAIILNKQNHKKHQSLHKNTNEHICLICKIRLKTKCKLQRHLEKHYLQYQCTSCPFTTKSTYVMRYHKCKQNLDSNATRIEEAKTKDDTDSSVKTYKCDQCEETFLYRRNMIEHARSHDITKFSCTKCDFSAETRKLLETHTQQAHKQIQKHEAKYKEVTESQSTTEPKLTCETCNKQYISAKSLQKHLYKCHKVTKKKGRGRPSIRNSVIILSEEEMWKYREQEANSLTFKYAKWKCEKCIIVFYNKLHFSKHERLHLLNFKFICNICTMSVQTAKALEEHTQTHYTLYKCVECDYSSYRKIGPNHYGIHKKEKKGFQCTICEKWFQQWLERNAHVKEHKEMMRSTKNVVSVYECDKCSKKFTHRKRIERHLIAHESTNKYECPVCPYRATCNSNLSAHYKLHHLMAPVLNEVYCVQCKKQFLTKDGYKLHIANVHKKSKTRLPCTFCDKDFSNKWGLKLHTDFYHLNQMNYECKFCNKKYSKKGSLQLHIKMIHEGFRQPKTHMCTFCEQGFSTRRILTHHVRTHTGERPHKCEYCNASFAQSYAMKTHVKKIHLTKAHAQCVH